MRVDLQDIKKMYGDKTVLDIENLTLKKGEFIGIIGPNGAGKSTLIQTIAGLIEPSQGKITYDGGPLSEKIQNQMTLVFQNPYLLRTTVFHNIAYPLILRKLDEEEIHRRVYWIMEELKISHLKDQKAYKLSGGEAQKVALGRALALNPKLLLLDEPTANIDPASILIMEDVLKSFHEKTKGTIIIISHNIHQSKRICETIILMEEGRIEAIDTKENIFKLRKYNKANAFIDTASMF